MKSSIEARLKKLEDIEEIRNLTFEYAHFVDKGCNGKIVNFEKLPLVFAEDARWQNSAVKVDVTGISQIVDMLKSSTAAVDFALHSFTNPKILIEGDKANATWLLWVGVKHGSVSNEVFQTEDVEYVRTTEGWRIQSIDLHFGTMLNG